MKLTSAVVHVRTGRHLVRTVHAIPWIHMSFTYAYYGDYLLNFCLVQLQTLVIRVIYKTKEYNRK